MISMSRWDGAYSSASYSLAKEFALNNRVFYVDHPFTIKDFIVNYRTGMIQTRKTALLSGKNIYSKPQGLPGNFTVATPPLTLPINWAYKDLYKILSRFNDTLFFSCIRKVIRDHKVNKYIFINSFDPFFGRNFPKDIQPDLKIYQSRDDISQGKYVARHGVWLEKEAAQQADIVLTTSKELTTTLSKVAKNTFFFPNAADISLFKTTRTSVYDKPKELKDVKGKIIGYTGNISKSRIDFDLLKNIAIEHSDKTLLLVGPVDSDDYIKYGLDKMSNVIFTGAKKINDLPAYLKYMDCAIIPFKCNTLTRSIYPLKINEYLAAGKPVVSTGFSEDIRDFNEVIYLSDSTTDFLEKINRSISEDSEAFIEKRIAEAEKNTWATRVETFWTIIEKYLD